MKFLMLFLAPVLCMAKPVYPEAGVAHFRGEFTVMQKRRTEVVYAFAAEGQKRLEELEQAGHTCEHVQRMIYRCVGFEGLEGAEAEVRALVSQRLQGATVTFRPRHGDPERINAAESLEEWLVPQKVVFLGKEYPNYRYWILGDLHKLAFGNPAVTGLVVRGDGSYDYVDTYSRTLSQEVFVSYLVGARFLR